MQKPLAPTPFCYNPKQVKAIVLGADPSNFSDKGNRKILTKTFGIGDGDSRYFQGILKNLKEIGLGLEDVYVDNLIQEYLDAETSKNKDWFIIAEKNISNLKKRLDEIDKSRITPVLLTAEKIYRVLMNDGLKREKPADLYSLVSMIPIAANENKVKRPLIPFFRNKDYSLSIQKWSLYRIRIIDILKSSSGAVAEKVRI
jgi:hypothetical protein